MLYYDKGEKFKRGVLKDSVSMPLDWHEKADGLICPIPQASVDHIQIQIQLCRIVKMHIPLRSV
jgi:hypothetical protein